MNCVEIPLLELLKCANAYNLNKLKVDFIFGIILGIVLSAIMFSVQLHILFYYKSAIIICKNNSEESADEFQRVAGPLQIVPAIEAAY
jgi:hypothetical protein